MAASLDDEQRPVKRLRTKMREHDTRHSLLTTRHERLKSKTEEVKDQLNALLRENHDLRTELRLETLQKQALE